MFSRKRICLAFTYFLRNILFSPRKQFCDDNFSWPVPLQHKGTEKRATKVQLVFQHCCKTVEKRCCAFYHPHQTCLATNQAGLLTGLNVGSLHNKRFWASSSWKLGREQKKGMKEEGEGSRSNFRAITRLETLATQARTWVVIKRTTSTRFAAILWDKLHVFCCPFFRTLSSTFSGMTFLDRREGTSYKSVHYRNHIWSIYR